MNIDATAKRSTCGCYRQQTPCNAGATKPAAAAPMAFKRSRSYCDPRWPAVRSVRANTQHAIPMGLFVSHSRYSARSLRLIDHQPARARHAPARAHEKPGVAVVVRRVRTPSSGVADQLDAWMESALPQQPVRRVAATHCSPDQITLVDCGPDWLAFSGEHSR